MMMNSQNENGKTVVTLAKACRDAREKLAGLLLDPAAAPEAVRAHMDVCDECTAELASYEATMLTMDEWTAPEPSAFFDTRLYARLREEQKSVPEGFFERLRSFVLYSTGRQLRPAMAGALGLVLIAGGAGSFAGFHHPAQSATVNDLRILDNNAQALQQMDQLLDDKSDDDSLPTS